MTETHADYRLSQLDELEAESIHIFREVAAEFEKPVLMFSGGKDSIVMMRLAEKAFYPAKIPFPVLQVDTGYDFPEVLETRDRWVERHDTDGEGPVDPEGRLRKWFRAPDTLKRCAHIDLAYSGDGDSLGFAMGHVRKMVEVDDEVKPYIVIDLAMRITAPSGSEIFLGNVRRLVYALIDDYGFKIDFVSMDGFESTDTKQQFRRKRLKSDIVSIDKDILPYHDLREAIYEDRIELPPYKAKYNRNDSELTEILVKELMELVDEGGKIDHPPDGSKDIADAVAGVTYHLMGDRRYHKKVVRMTDHVARKAAVGDGTRPLHPAMVGDNLSAPIPPGLPDWARPPR